ncbi:MAG: FRG domain-containing protein [Bacteroidales bacterium]|jgi:hypothetical protein|nr:FRG domain-containing protein [Bacteroidales bacterium]
MMESPNDIRISGWSELQEMLFRDSWDGHLGRFRSPYVYRGLSDVNYELKTSLMRIGGPYNTLERHLLRNFRKYAHRNTVSGESLWNLLAIAQHHGLPTRLLDWTYSPYVALHFATANILKFNIDGAIWCVNYVRSNNYLPENLNKIIVEEGSNVFTPQMLELECNSLRQLEAMSEHRFVMFLEPPSMDERIVNQHALFSLMSNATLAMSSWLNDHNDLYFRIIIPAKLKWEIRDKLDQANITERVLFPGLDGLSSWLKRQYSPSPEQDSRETT